MDSSFTFEIDGLKEAKPIKYVEDARHDTEPEVWVVQDEDAEPPEPEVSLPLRSGKGPGSPWTPSEFEKKELAKQQQASVLKRLHRATVIRLIPEHQGRRPSPVLCSATANATQTSI